MMISSDLKTSEILKETCFQMNGKFISPKLCCNTLIWCDWKFYENVWYIYIAFYYSFLNVDDQNLYRTQLDDVFYKFSQNYESKNLQKMDRFEKKTIRKKLFYSRKKTLLQCSLFSKVLKIMKRYVLLFQQNELAIFRLFHDS